jgi:hypothetical protein
MTVHTTFVAHRQLRLAVGALCTGAELSARLERAHRELAGIDAARNLPETLQHRFEELLADIAYGAESVRDALGRMSSPDREHLADRIVSLFDEAVRQLEADA